jgi:phosphohistidine phosphatase
VYIFLVHHADALGPAVDARRPLSRLGHAQAEWLAIQARARNVRPVAIWHSGKLRARETAEYFLRLCNPFAWFKMMRGLQPGDPTTWMEEALALEEDDVLVVGHLPHLPALARQLAAVDVPLHGMICLERVDDGGYAERWRAQPPENPAIVRS